MSHAELSVASFSVLCHMLFGSGCREAAHLQTRQLIVLLSVGCLTRQLNGYQLTVLLSVDCLATQLIA